MHKGQDSGQYCSTVLIAQRSFIVTTNLFLT